MFNFFSDHKLSAWLESLLCFYKFQSDLPVIYQFVEIAILIAKWPLKMEIILSFFTFAFLINKSSSTIFYDDSYHLSYLTNDAFALNYYHPFYNQTIDFVKLLIQTKSINQQCRSSLKRLITGIEDRDQWALKCK